MGGQLLLLGLRGLPTWMATIALSLFLTLMTEQWGDYKSTPPLFEKIVPWHHKYKQLIAFNKHCNRQVDERQHDISGGCTENLLMTQLNLQRDLPN
jgi:hypothetical protein